jgi:UDP-N-acetylglucosamine 4,6-dehydratase
LGNALVSYFLNHWTNIQIIVYSRDEWKQAEMAERINDKRVRFFLGDVRDKDRLKRAMCGVDTVIHAAALKRVDAVSYNPAEVIKTNVLGTQNVCEAAIDERVTRLVVVSSDKAVNPQNIYGASKFMAEQYAIAANAYSPHGTKISCVRYGNVLGSRGSVVLIWKALLDQGKKLPVTNIDATRFLITFEQAVELIEQALASMEGREIFIPYLRGAKITDLAEAMGGEWYETELRPGGEKIHESLLTEEECWRTLSFAGCLVVKPFYKGERRPPYRSDNDLMTVGEIRALLEGNGFA